MEIINGKRYKFKHIIYNTEDREDKQEKIKIRNNFQTHSLVYVSIDRVWDAVMYANHSMLTANVLVTSIQIMFHHKIHG